MATRRGSVCAPGGAGASPSGVGGRPLSAARRTLGMALILTAVGGSRSSAQEPASRSFGLLLSQSITSATAAEAPTCPCDRGRDVLAPVSVATIEIELAVPLRQGRAWGLEYAARAVPLAMVRNNPRDAAYMNPLGGWTMSLDTPRASTAGFGVKPVGLRGWAGAGRVRLQADVTAGVVRFGSPALASNATRFNFVYEVGVGVRFIVPGAGHAAIGFRRHHLSNAGLGEVNPGLDSHMAYLGFWLD